MTKGADIVETDRLLEAGTLSGNVRAHVEPSKTDRFHAATSAEAMFYWIRRTAGTP